ncbi:innexin family member shaking B isoform X1 [Lasioglossum baleicum]|uniref:innexin family member shaking B isoform X1 n=1 Tax=Lasioglossum baleicum TaxID=434251 RepID=UPI003FCD0D02
MIRFPARTRRTKRKHEQHARNEASTIYESGDFSRVARDHSRKRICLTRSRWRRGKPRAFGEARSPKTIKDAPDAEDDRCVRLPSVPVQGTKAIRGCDCLPTTLSRHGGATSRWLCHVGLQKHFWLAYSLRGRRFCRQGRLGDVLLASHHLQHGARVQQEPRPGSSLSGSIEQQGRRTARPHAPSIDQTAQVLSAMLFYTPRWLWKGWEGGKIHALMMDLDIALCSEAEKKQKKKMLLDYLWENLRFHNWWAYRYYLCEVLALVNVVGQMFLMNRFFDGAFLTFGIDVLRFLESDQEDRVDPMIYVFPRMTKCTFHKFGVSGEVERHDAVCILPLNVVNEKIYVFLWFWFLFLGFLSFMTVLYRILIIFSPRTRVYLLRLRFRLVRREAIETIVRRSKVGDWFLLYMLGENLDTVIYRDVMHELANKLASRHHHSVPGIKGELQEA